MNISEPETDEGDKQKYSDSMSDDSDIPEPLGIRCFIQNGSKLDRWLLVYHSYFLPCISIILWIIFLF